MAARVWLGLAQAELADRALTSAKTIKRLEKSIGRLIAHSQTLHGIEAAFHDAGVEFIEDGFAFFEPNTPALERGVYVSYGERLGPAQVTYLQEALGRAGYAVRRIEPEGAGGEG